MKQQFPEPTVGALIFNKKNEIFLMKSHKWSNKWVIPGGHIELGETIEQALRREVKEETRLNIHDIEFLCFQEFIFDKEFWRKRHFLFFDFICKTDSKNVTLNSEAQEFVFVPIKDTLKLSIDPYTRHAIKLYLKKIDFD